MTGSIIPLAIKTLAAAGGTLLTAAGVWQIWWKSLSPDEKAVANNYVEDQLKKKQIVDVASADPHAIEVVLNDAKKARKKRATA
ncbi:MAG: hypothetical protein ACK4Y5_14395 [Acetobacteraceae bacterium]|jgi:hypothetical protein